MGVIMKKRVIIGITVLALFTTSCANNTTDFPKEDNKKIGSEHKYTSESVGYTKVPFTSFTDGRGGEYTAEIDMSDLSFRLCSENKSIIELPPDHIPLKIIRVDEVNYVFCKTRYYSSCRLLRIDDKNTIEKITLGNEEVFDEYIFRDAVYYHNDVESRLYFVVYNTTTNSHQLHRIELSGNKEKYDEAFSYDLYFGDNEIDENVKMVISDDRMRFRGLNGIYIFGSQNYYTYNTWSPISIKGEAYPSNGRMTEVAKCGNSSFCLIELPDNDGWHVIDVNSYKSSFDTTVDEESLTATLDYVDGYIRVKPVFKDDLIPLFRRDLTNLQCGGMIECGSNNLEGRIPWAQVYYLNGMIDMTSDWFWPDGYYAQDVELIKTDLERRLTIEISLIDDLFKSAQSIVTKRSCLERTPGVFALHADRIIEILNRYRRFNNSRFVIDNDLRRKAYDFDGTVEYLALGDGKHPSGVEKNRHYEKLGNEMLMNNVASPFNFHSEYVKAVSIEELYFGGMDDSRKDIAMDFLRMLMYSPYFTDFDDKYEWPYWTGDVYDGWEENDECHVKYVGKSQRRMAHISYKSIDSMAMLYGMKVFPELFDEEVVDYLKNGVENGKLYPFVNEALLECGYGLAPIDIDGIREYIRIRHSWELQSAVWAYYFALNTGS